MQIPFSYAEDIIGIGGANIAHIRRASGAVITVQESRGQFDEITVEIKGSSSQVQIAQQLIQSALAFACLVLHTQEFMSQEKDPVMSSSYGDTSYGSLFSQLGSTSYSSSLPTQPYGGYGGSSSVEANSNEYCSFGFIAEDSRFQPEATKSIGTLGRLFRGKYQGDEEVAVKILERPSDADMAQKMEQQLQFAQEVTILSELNHPNQKSVRSMPLYLILKQALDVASCNTGGCRRRGCPVGLNYTEKVEVAYFVLDGGRKATHSQPLRARYRSTTPQIKGIS
ncbi:hypothetical protein COLO4_07097 [Corchorus olitorius]|uniref:K Homology domain-containing protein n=1 Tax=Corchorus olitorius TaxID=93759 RepID=A0A1R3KKW8_9ROSI|nr:hypothetical protein COLO4_07097 [Corchorus olitorius]